MVTKVDFGPRVRTYCVAYGWCPKGRYLAELQGRRLIPRRILDLAVLATRLGTFEVGTYRIYHLRGDDIWIEGKGRTDHFPPDQRSGSCAMYFHPSLLGPAI